MRGWSLRAAPAILILALAAILQPTAAAATASSRSDALARCLQTGAETVTTDEADYAPHETVHITGSGYASSCEVTVRVTRPDGSVVKGDGTFTPGSETVTTDAAGEFSYDYILDGIEGVYTVDVLGLGATVLARVSFTDSFGLTKLRLGSSKGPENYVYTAGDVIFPQAELEPRKFYKLVVKDAGGTVRNPPFPCTPTGSFSTTNNTYTVQAADPVSTNKAWTYTLTQYTNSTCTTQDGGKTDSLYFDVAKATIYGDSGLTSLQSTFGAGAAAYLTVAGLGKTRNSPTNNAESDWGTKWITPSSATACANIGGTDRPDSTPSGVLPGTGGSFLQYPPNTTPTGAPWDWVSNYETSPCPAFGSANEGTWKLRLEKDGTHFVVLTVFTVDATPPTVSAPDLADSSDTGSSNSDNLTKDNSPTFNGTAEAGATVSLLRDGALVDTTTADGGTWSITDPGPLADGVYSYTAQASDAAGNTSPESSALAVTIDTAEPTSAIAFPLDGAIYSASGWNAGCGTLAGDFCGSASDSGAAGLDKVEVSIKREGNGKYWDGDSFDAAGELFFEATGDASWSYSFAATNFPASGDYTVHARATDHAGNVESSPTATFTIETPPPPSGAGVPPAASLAAATVVTGQLTPSAVGCHLRLTKTKLFVGLDTTIRVRALRDDGSPAVGVAVVLTGTHGIVRQQGVTNARGLVQFTVKVKTQNTRIKLSAPGGCARTLRAVRATNCSGISVTPKTLGVAERTAVTVRVRLFRRPVSDALVALRGAGIAVSGTTDESGVARLVVTATRPGIVRVGVPTVVTCSKKFGVLGESAGIELTG